MAQRRFTLSLTEAELRDLVSALRCAWHEANDDAENYRLPENHAPKAARMSEASAYRYRALQGRVEAALAVLNEQQVGA